MLLARAFLRFNRPRDNFTGPSPTSPDRRYGGKYERSSVKTYIRQPCRADAVRRGRPLAVVVVGGLVTATLLTLVVLPTFYQWFEEHKF
jgi:hypothetical protein